MLESLVELGKTLIVSFSYLGIFLISFLSTSSIFFPTPLYLLIFFASGLGLHPFIVGVSAGVGSGLGEITGYLIGVGGREVAIQNKKSKFAKTIEFYFRKYGFLTIVIAAFLPFPFDFVGILSGMSKYEVKKFLLAAIIGKTIKTTLIAYMGYWILPPLGGMLL